MTTVHILLSMLLSEFLVCGVSAVQAQSSSSWIARYQARVTATQSAQPHWITPLVTVMPPFLAHQQPGTNDGFGDVSFNSKFRIFARNEEHGNAILTAFLAGTVPTGKNGNGSCCAVVTTAIAGGKGWGNFDLESTLGGSLPVTNAKGLGHTIAWNNTLQYRLARLGAARFFWPEAEFNSSFFSGGANDGKKMLFATPGLIVGRIPLARNPDGSPGRMGLTFGAGEQIALTHFHTYNHAIVLTARVPF